MPVDAWKAGSECGVVARYSPFSRYAKKGGEAPPSLDAVAGGAIAGEATEGVEISPVEFVLGLGAIAQHHLIFDRSPFAGDAVVDEVEFDVGDRGQLRG